MKRIIRILLVVALLGISLLSHSSKVYAATIEVQIGATANDTVMTAVTTEGSGGTFGTSFSTSYLALGNYNATDKRSIMMLFTGITIPAGSIITTAYISYYNINAQSDTDLNTTIWGDDSGTPTAPTNAATFWGKTKTTASVNANNFATFTANTWINSPDISSIIQELVDSYSYTTGSIQLIQWNNGSSTGIRRTLADYNYSDHTYSPKLHIEYTSGVPIITTQAASDVTMDKDGVTGGTFNGNLTDLGSDTDAYTSFEYGLTTGYGSETTPSNKGSTGSFTDDIPDDLTPGETYHYRSKAVNDYGTAYGSDQQFTFTMPSFTTEAADYTSPGAATATLNGNISDLQKASSCYGYFEWGYDTGYGNTTSPQSLSATGDFDDDISGFLHNAIIHYRAVIEVGATTSNGSDNTLLIAPSELTEVGYYQPITIIQATTLPDRDTADGSQDGAITWGTNPAGITYTLGSIVPINGYTPPAPTNPFIPTGTPTAPAHLYSELNMNFFGSSLIQMLADLSGIPLAIWVFGYAFGAALILGLLAYRLTMGKKGLNRGSITAQALVSGCVMIYFYVAGGGVIPGWVLIPFFIEALAAILWRQSPNPW